MRGGDQVDIVRVHLRVRLEGLAVRDAPEVERVG
jgi:hypothetical protein